jgi:general secretion pathway protein G
MSRSKERGFTLVELLVVIAIIGLLAGIVGVNVVGKMRKARQMKARADIENISSACDMFKIDTARYPNDLMELIQPPADSLRWDGPYLDKTTEPLDPWDNPYQYYVDSQGYTIVSYGADGVEGGEDENMDISNHDEELGAQ